MDRSDIITDANDPRRCGPGEVEVCRQRIKELEERNKLLSRDNINLRKFIVNLRNKLSDFITNDLESK